MTIKQGVVPDFKIEGGRPRLGLSEIDEILAGVKGIVVQLEEMSREKKFLLEILNAGIIGQSQACEEIATKIDLGLNRLMYRKGPLGVAFLSGPTGVGKTESVRVLAKALLGDENAYTCINCEQFQQDHTMRDLFGAPKSYVGYGSPTPLASEKIFAPFEAAKKGNNLASIIKGKRDFGLLLFDEIEKAHPNIRQSLLALLDDGKINFPNGNSTSFENIFIVMTSNVGEHELSQMREKGSFGFGRDRDQEGQQKEKFVERLKKEFSPEFLGRVGDPIRFTPLCKNDCTQIVTAALESQNRLLATYFITWNIHIGISPLAVDWIVEKGYNPQQGARQLSRVIEKYIFFPTHRILRNNRGAVFLSRKNPTILYIDCVDEGLEYTFHTPDIIKEPRREKIEKPIYTESTSDQVESVLNDVTRILNIVAQYKEDGLSDEEIKILQHIDMEKTLTIVFEAENMYDGTNLYQDADVFGDTYTPRWIRGLIERKAREIIKNGGISLHIFILSTITRSILTMERLLEISQLSQEQEEVVIRFAVISAYKTWGVI